MDFETLITLALIGLYLFFQVLGARKKQQRRPAAQDQPLPDDHPPALPRPAQEPTLDDALREIRQALGMEVPPAPPPPTPPPPALPQRQVAHEQPVPSEFRPFPSHFPDADFEAQPTAFGTTHSIHKTPPVPPKVKARGTRATPKKPKASLTALPSGQTAPGGVDQERLVRRLREPAAAREAFILGEILGLPRAMRRR